MANKGDTCSTAVKSKDGDEPGSDPKKAKKAGAPVVSCLFLLKHFFSFNMPIRQGLLGMLS